SEWWMSSPLILDETGAATDWRCSSFRRDPGIVRPRVARPESSKGVCLGRHALRGLRACHPPPAFSVDSLSPQFCEPRRNELRGRHFWAAVLFFRMTFTWRAVLPNW